MLEKLLKIQNELKAPKGQRNTFGNYNYRSAEDILEAVKPIALKHKALVLLSDQLVVLGEHNPQLYTEMVWDKNSKKEVEKSFVLSDQRFYIKATAIFIDIETSERLEVCAYAREEETKKGMDGSQITGTASSYARKYALNGLFAIDDTKDSDGTNEHGKGKKEPEPKPEAEPKEIKKATLEQIDELVELLTPADLLKAKNYFIKKGVDKLEEADFDTIQRMIDKQNAKV